MRLIVWSHVGHASSCDTALLRSVIFDIFYSVLGVM
jgi:hypothetical protein